jgi:hypothetical protein
LLAVDTGEVAERAVQPVVGSVSWIHVCASADLRREKHRRAVSRAVRRWWELAFS